MLTNLIIQTCSSLRVIHNTIKFIYLVFHSAENKYANKNANKDKF